jgi:hypothetical protein
LDAIEDNLAPAARNMMRWLALSNMQGEGVVRRSGVTRHVTLGGRTGRQDQRISAWLLKRSVIRGHLQRNRETVTFKTKSSFFACAEFPDLGVIGIRFHHSSKNGLFGVARASRDRPASVRQWASCVVT